MRVYPPSFSHIFVFQPDNLMKSKAFGLDIGTSTMKAVWLTEQNDFYLLNSASMIPTPSKGMLSESPLDQEEMAQAIKTIITNAKITAKYVNIALPENQVYTRVLEMPVLSDKELSSAIYWEAEQYIPIPLENIALDWRVLKRPNEQESTNKMQVLLVGAPELLINKYERIIEMAGLSLNAVETEILAAVRALSFTNMSNATKETPNTLIINIGALSTSMVIIKNGLIVFTYSVPTGGAAINRAIASDFGFTVAQAEEYKKVYGVSDKNLEGKIGKASKPILLSIMGELKKALAYYNEKYKDSPIRQILLSGGSARLPGLDLLFAQNSGIETVIANPWKVISNQSLPKEIIENAANYTIAVGLAMREYE